jgi:response regulator RpfG family c-di-GMP phosphodiesterase
MPDMDGYEVLRRLKSEVITQHIPVILLTGVQGPENELEGLTLGAADYISKPFTPQLLRKRVKLQITVRNQERLIEQQARKLEALEKGLKPHGEAPQNLLDQQRSGVLAEEFLREVRGVLEKQGKDLFPFLAEAYARATGPDKAPGR